VVLFQIVREVPLAPSEAWERLTDWDQHSQFVPLTTIVRTPRGFVARTGIGPVGFVDPMEIVQWQAPSFCRLQKRGRVVTGWAELTVEPSAAGSRVTWLEDIHIRGTTRFLAGPTRFAATKVFSRVIDGLLADPAG